MPLEVRNGGSGGNRTHDQWIKSPVLYRLSYRPTWERRIRREGPDGRRMIQKVAAKFTDEIYRPQPASRSPVIPRRIGDAGSPEAIAPQAASVAAAAAAAVIVGLVA
jgi:hypothetical protein